MREQDDRPIGRTNVVAAGKRRVIPWIWEGVVAEGAVTLLSAPGTPGQHQRPVQPHQPVPGGRVRRPAEGTDQRVGVAVEPLGQGLTG